MSITESFLISCETIEGDDWMDLIFNIDFHSDEALYTQLCNQIIIGIAKETVHEGDSLPSVRQLAEEVGINMHTVNKAYTVLKQEGFVKVDRRRGVIIAVNTDKLRALAETKENLRILLARASCMNISREEIHALIDEIYREYE
jgi:DNA-binding transcriptional regulator YhcF (GntR family)